MQKYNPRQKVELFHLLFLSQLGSKLDKKLYAIKGGCNMRFYFNSIRYSEDLDIDIQIVNQHTLEKNVNQILKSIPFNLIIQSHDLQILNVSFAKQTSTTQRWKILLKTKASLPLHTKIEFSRRKFGRDVKFESINSLILKQYSLVPIMATHYSMQSTYEQKILALSLRRETQARDIFDLFFLINAGVDVKMIDKETKEHLTQAKNNAKGITFANFKSQVIVYLEEEYQQQYDDSAVWRDILNKVLNALDSGQ